MISPPRHCRNETAVTPTPAAPLQVASSPPPPGEGKRRSSRTHRFNCQTALGRASAFSRRGLRPSFASTCHPLKNRGRRESRVRAAPAVSCAKWKKTHTSIQVQRRQSGFPCAMVYGLYRALPGDRAFLPPSPLRSLLPRNLTPASGRQDHTTSPSAHACVRLSQAFASTASHRAFVTIATRPSHRVRRAEAMPLICPTR